MKIIQNLSDTLINGDWFVFLLLIILVPTIFFLKSAPSKLLDKLLSSKQNELDFLKNISTDENLSKDLTQHALNLFEDRFFNKFFKIKANKHRREKLKELYEALSPYIEWDEIRRASPYIKIEPDIATYIKINTFDKFEFGFGKYGGLILRACATLSALLAIAALANSNFKELIIGIIMFIFLALYSYLIETLSWPVRDARKINNLINY